MQNQRVKGHVEKLISDIFSSLIVDENGNPVEEKTEGVYGKKFTLNPKPKNILFSKQKTYQREQEELVPEYVSSPIFVPKSEIHKH